MRARTTLAIGSTQVRPRFHPTPELQLPDQGGPRLVRADLVTLTFAGFPFESDIEAFGDFLPGSNWIPIKSATSTA